MYLVRPPYLYRELYSKAVWRKETVVKTLYLTFDDGPIPELTPWILDVLKKHKIPATFFCVGDNIEKHPLVYQRIINEGHQIGNHTFNHLSAWKVGLGEYMDNVKSCQEKVTVQNNNQLFRPPYGRLSRKKYAALQEEGYKIIMWDVLSGDFDSKTTPKECLSNVIDNIRKGSIIVFHDNTKAEENLKYALPRFIEFALSEGYQFDKL